MSICSTVHDPYVYIHFVSQLKNLRMLDHLLWLDIYILMLICNTSKIETILTLGVLYLRLVIVYVLQIHSFCTWIFYVIRDSYKEFLVIF